MEATTFTLTPRCVDFSKTPLNVYTDLYAKVVDDVFTPSECASLISLASSSEGWKPAALHYGLEPSQQYLNSSVRHNERILRFDSDTADKIYARVLPLVQDMADIRPGGKWDGITMSARQGKGSWKLVGYVMSFLLWALGLLDARTDETGLILALTNALVSCVMGRATSSSLTTTDKPISQTGESPA